MLILWLFICVRKVWWLILVCCNVMKFVVGLGVLFGYWIWLEICVVGIEMLKFMNCMLLVCFVLKVQGCSVLCLCVVIVQILMVFVLVCVMVCVMGGVGVRILVGGWVEQVFSIRYSIVMIVGFVCCIFVFCFIVVDILLMVLQEYICYFKMVFCQWYCFGVLLFCCCLVVVCVCCDVCLIDYGFVC